MNKKTFLNQIKKVLMHYDEDAELILFGSRAKGKAGKNSDWDILILLNEPASERLKEKIRNSLLELELETDQVISSIIHSKDKWKQLSVTPFYQNIEAEGIVA